MVWVRHFNYLSFERFGLPTPVYVNLVRDPLERVISFFYYRRAGWNIVERIKAFPDEPLPDPEFLRKDYETCVLEGDPECSYIKGSISPETETGDHRRQVMNYCGQEIECASWDSMYALNKAKENVMNHYVVVGLVEMWEETLEVLEHKVPFFFQGAREVFSKNKKKIRGMAHNRHKGFVSE